MNSFANFFFMAFLLTFLSCSREYSEKELWEMAQKEDPQIQIIIQKDGNPPLNTCNDYSEGCKSVRTLSVKKLSFVVVEFESEDLAYKEALRLDAYYLDQWLLDDVAGEPILEKFIEKAFPVKRPRKNLQDKE